VIRRRGLPDHRRSRPPIWSVRRHISQVARCLHLLQSPPSDCSWRWRPWSLANGSTPKGAVPLAFLVGGTMMAGGMVVGLMRSLSGRGRPS